MSNQRSLKRMVMKFHLGRRRAPPRGMGNSPWNDTWFRRAAMRLAKTSRGQR